MQEQKELHNILGAIALLHQCPSYGPVVPPTAFASQSISKHDATIACVTSFGLVRAGTVLAEEARRKRKALAHILTGKDEKAVFALQSAAKAELPPFAAVNLLLQGPWARTDRRVFEDIELDDVAICEKLKDMGVALELRFKPSCPTDDSMTHITSVDVDKILEEYTSKQVVHRAAADDETDDMWS